VPAGYLNSLTHGRWMKLTYSHGRESRQTRRCLGAALRNIGAIQGSGNGARFAPWFDETIDFAYRRAVASGKMPGSVFRLIQMLYDEYFLPRLGVGSGWVVFGTLLSVLRGRDGSARGAAAYESYQAYRRAALLYKNAYRHAAKPEELLELRKQRRASLALWQQNLHALIDAYASRKLTLNPEFVIRPEMIEGFDIYTNPELPPPPSAPPQLKFAHEGGRMLITWDGGGVLQHAPAVNGPWQDVAKSSPAVFDLTQPQGFFRAVRR